METNKPVEKLSVDELNAFRAIEMWYNVLYRCKILTTNDHIDNYRGFISNALSQPNLEEVIKQVRKVISDFYDYFYIKKNIAHLNYRNYHLLTNDYAQFGSIVLKLKYEFKREGTEFINILIETALYAFEKVSPFRKKWNLYIFENEKEDEYIVKYFSIFVEETKNEETKIEDIKIPVDNNNPKKFKKFLKKKTPVVET